MSVTLEPIAETGLTKFSALHAELAELAEKYASLKIAGLNDKAGYKAVHDARMIIRRRRTDVEKTRKDLKAAALEYGRTVDAEAERLTAILEPVETHLQRQEDAIDAEKERIKKAAEDAKSAIIQQRIDSFTRLGWMINPSMAAEWTEEVYQTQYQLAKEKADQRDKQEAERLRVEAEEKAAREAEAARLIAERAELNRIAAEQKAERERMEFEQAAERVRLAKEREKAAEEQRAEQRKIEAERHRVAEEQRLERERIAAAQQALEKAEYERKHAIEIEQARKDAAEKARLETEARLKREAEEALEFERAERQRIANEQAAIEAARLKAEEEKPIRLKIMQIAQKLTPLGDVLPDGPARKKVDAVLARAAKSIREIAQGPLSTGETPVLDLTVRNGSGLVHFTDKLKDGEV